MTRRNSKLALIVLPCIASYCVYPPAHAQRDQAVEDKNTEAVPSVEGGPVILLSDLAPGHLADFIRTSVSGNREVSIMHTQLIDQGAPLGTWAAKIVSELKLVNSSTSEFPVRISEQEKGTLIIAGTDVRLSNGNVIHQGNLVPSSRADCVRGQPCRPGTVASGLVVNGSNRRVNLSNDRDEPIAIEPGSAIFVGSQDQLMNYQSGLDGEGEVAGSCTVNCGSGTYACCTYSTTGNNRPKCRCMPNTTAPVCDGGGVGSPSCSLTE